jgi:hypothetical protein
MLDRLLVAVGAVLGMSVDAGERGEGRGTDRAEGMNAFFERDYPSAVAAQTRKVFLFETTLDGKMSVVRDVCQEMHVLEVV